MLYFDNEGRERPCQQNEQRSRGQGKAKTYMIYVQSEQQFSLLEVIARDEAAEKTDPVLNNFDSRNSLKGLRKVDTQSDLHFKYIPLYKQLVKCCFFAYEHVNC